MSDFENYFSASGESAWFVPGRIEVLGKHTDYAGGRSLVTAVEAGITIRGVRTAGTDEREPVITIYSESVDEELKLNLAHPDDLPQGHWGRYIQTVITRLDRNFAHLLGSAELRITSTLPLASGMSSSSALVVAVANVLVELFDLASTPQFRENLETIEDYAGYCGCLENGLSFRELIGTQGVGTFGGSQDHTAILCAKPDALLEYRFAPVVYEGSVPLPSTEWQFVVATSGVLAEKTGKQLADYNRVSAAVREIVKRWNEATNRDDPTLYAAVHSGDDAIEKIKTLCEGDDYLPGRFEQFLAEAEEIIPAAFAALERADVSQFGELVARSQKLAETHLGNQIRQTVALVDLAHSLGAVAASAFGAGFGGSVYALVKADSAEEFAAQWLARYRELYPAEGAQAATLITGASGGARRI